MNSVKVGEVSVTLASIADIRAEAARLAEAAARLQASASQHRAGAVARLAEAGMILVAREKEWLPANPAATYQLTAARAAIARVDEVGGVPAEDEGKPRFALFGRRKESESPEVREERERRGAQLRVVLAELGRNFGNALGVVSSSRDRALEMESRADADLVEAAELQRQAAVLEAEALHRERASKEMGFDAPLLAATLQQEGVPAVKSPLELHPGEVAYLVEAAELARDRGFAINAPRATEPAPAAMTGILYMVGTQREQGIARDALSMLGPGQFVVTSKRLAFVGKLKTFAFGLDDVRRVDHFRDGLCLFREGRDYADVVLSPSASRILFYINWVLLHRG